MPENDQWPSNPTDEAGQAHPSVDAPPEETSAPAEEEPDDALSADLPEERDTELSPVPPGDEDLIPGEAVEQLLPALEQTGHEGVDVALATLDDLASASVHEHVAVFEATHEELRRALNDVAATGSTPGEQPDPGTEDSVEPPH